MFVQVKGMINDLGSVGFWFYRRSEGGRFIAHPTVKALVRSLHLG
jgi:hypothetical protein